MQSEAEEAKSIAKVGSQILGLICIGGLTWWQIDYAYETAEVYSGTVNLSLVVAVLFVGVFSLGVNAMGLRAKSTNSHYGMLMLSLLVLVVGAIVVGGIFPKYYP